MINLFILDYSSIDQKLQFKLIKKYKVKDLISMNIDDELYKLMVQNNPQVNPLRLRAISGNNKLMDQFIKIIKNLLKDQNNHHIAYKQVNQFLVSGRPEVVDQINQRIIPDIIKVHCRQDLDQYILLWKSIMNGTNNNYPNFQQKLKNVKLSSSDKRELSAPLIKSKNQFIKNSKALDQKVQFFEDSYRISHDTRKTNSIEDFIDSFSSHSQSSIAIQKQMEYIDNIRVQVQRGPLDQQIARKHLNTIKKFLSKKPRSLKKTLSLNFNDDRIWCQQYVDNYNKYLLGGSLHIYKHFNALVTQNNYQGGQEVNKKQDPVHITIRKGIDEEVFKEDLKKRNSKRLIINSDDINQFGNMTKNRPYLQQNFMRSQNASPNIQNNQGQYYKSMPPGFYQNFDKMNLPKQQFPSQPIEKNQLNQLNQVQDKPAQNNNMFQSFNSQAYTYVPPPNQLINQQNPHTRTQEYTSPKNQPIVTPQTRVYSTVQSFGMNSNDQPQQITYGQSGQTSIGKQNAISPKNEIKYYSRGLKGVKNPKFYQTEALEFNQSQAQTYYNPKNIQNINPAYYHSQAFPYNPNELSPYAVPGQQLNKQPGDPVFILDGKTTPIKSLAPLAGSKSSDNLFFASSRSRQRPKIFGNSARRSRIQQPDQGDLSIKKYGQLGKQPYINQPQGEYYTQNMQNMQKQTNNSASYNRNTFLTDYHSPKNSLKIQDNNPRANLINQNERGQNPYPNQVSKPFAPYRSDPGYYSPQKNTFQNYQIESNPSRLIKLSQFHNQKKKRKQGIVNQPFQSIQQFILMPYIKHFNEMTMFNRFRRNCLQNKFVLYASPELLVNGTTEMVTDSKIKVQLTYKNQTDSNLYLQTLYRVPSSLKVQKKTKINKTSLIDEQIIHSYCLDLVSFPLQPCLLNLKYAREQRYESFKTSYPVIISLPITLRNFLPYLVLNEYQWKQKWDQWTHNSNYLIMRNFPLDTTMIQQKQLGQGLKQYTKLTAIPGQSVRQYGAYCSHQNFNNLAFLLRISQRVDNIITLYILANKRFLNQDQNDYLQYCLSIWAMLLAKIQPDQVQ